MTKSCKLYYCLMYLFISCECFEIDNVMDSDDYVPRVVNGRSASLGDVPYQVSFKLLVSRVRKQYRSFCGGTIIGPQKLVSAAHCFEVKGSQCKQSMSKTKYTDQKQLQRIHVVAGNLWNDARYSPGMTNIGQWRKLRSMAYPGKYRFPNNDISVGVTTTAFIFNDHVQPVRSIARSFQDYTGTCLVSGYGRINKVTLSDRLLLADLVLIRSAACSRIHRRNMKKFICTQSRPSDIEKGDSGGPLVCFGTTLVGVVSGYREGAGSFFTRVSAFSHFIDNNGIIGLRSNFITLSLYPVYVLLKFYYYSDC